MLINKTIKSSICLVLALLFIGTSNHCAVEDLFTTISNSVSGEIQPDHHSTPVNTHNHEESSGSHEHGQPHQLVSVQNQKTGADLVKIILIALPFSLIITLGNSFNLQMLQIKMLPRPIFHQPEQLKEFISSLVLAPQGPPSRS